MPISYNGWSAAPGWSIAGGQLEAVLISGEPFSPGVRAGDVATVFRRLAQRMHDTVEPIVASSWHQADDWGYSYRQNRNAANLSCHASGTAIDYNATRHPNGKRGTFTAEQVAGIRAILSELRGLVRWGGDFTGTPDEMHFEIIGTPVQVAALVASWGGAAPNPSPAPVAPPAAVAGMLQRGSKGEAVRALQQRLRTAYPAYRHTIGGGLIVADGAFGPTTAQRVREFQRRTGLAVDGIAGPRTLKALGL